MYFRVVDTEFVVYVEYAQGHVIHAAAAVEICSAEVERLSPVVADCRELHEEITDEVVELLLTEAPRSEVIRERLGEVVVESAAERTNLIRVDTLGQHEIEVDKHQPLV